MVQSWDIQCRSGGDGIRIGDNTATAYSKERRRSARPAWLWYQKVRGCWHQATATTKFSINCWLNSSAAWASGAALLSVGTSDSSGVVDDAAAAVAALSAGARRPAPVAAMIATSSSWRLRASERFFDGISSIAGGSSAEQAS